jgi:AraC-like DNA-binding protein
MLYLEHRPPPPLNAFIETLWYTAASEVSHHRQRILPNGSVQLIINLAEDYINDCSRTPGDASVVRLGPALIAGVHTEVMVIDTADLTEMIGLQFWPGGVIPFFGIPADEFSNTHTDLEALEGRLIRVLRDRLREAPTPEAKFRVLEETLLSIARPRLARHAAVDFALRQFPEHSVADVTRQIGLSPRRFAQVFREQVGVTPKLFCRIRRFQQAVRQISQGRDVNWADIALSCGYFDQSHFANDFRAFSGITPANYRAHRSTWMNHVDLGD